MSEAEVVDADDFGPELAHPICGCCRQKVTILKERGRSGRAGSDYKRFVVVRLVRPCICHTLPVCWWCHKCSGCCECPTPFFMES